jgi:hypothetical protein
MWISPLAAFVCQGKRQEQIVSLSNSKAYAFQCKNLRLRWISECFHFGIESHANSTELQRHRLRIDRIDDIWVWLGRIEWRRLGNRRVGVRWR